MITTRDCRSMLATGGLPSPVPRTLIRRWLARAAACMCMSSIAATPLVARQPPRAAHPLDRVSNACRLRVALLQSSVLSAAASRAMQDEVARIWQPYDVTFDWCDMDPADNVPPETLAVSVRAGGLDASLPPVGGVVVFATPVRPVTLIRLQIATGRVFAAARVGGRPLGQWPPVVREPYIGLALGRVLAHEIGHYVLATRQHTETGLMRPAFSVDEVVGPHGAGFRLSPASEALVAPTWLARSTCDHLTSALAPPSVLASR